MKAFPWEKGETDVKIVRMLATMTSKKAAEILGITEAAVNERLQRIKVNKVRYRWWLNSIQSTEQISQRIKKRLILPEPLKDEGELKKIEFEEELSNDKTLED